jgi:nucleotidyltransferase substrate binding protein (TIGR01987 family)
MALEQFRQAIKLSEIRELTELEKLGLIQTFEITHELAWKVMRDYIRCKREEQLMDARDTTCKASFLGLINDRDNWLEMIESRNLGSHTYNAKRVGQLLKKIRGRYASCFESFEEGMLHYC